MLEELIDDLILPDSGARRVAPSLPAGAAVVGALPSGLVFTERAAATLRRFLAQEGLNHYRIFQSWALDVDDIEEYLRSIGEPAGWETIEANIRDGESVGRLTRDETHAWLWDAGILRVARHEVVFARWFWQDKQWQMRMLCAAPSAEAYLRLRRSLLEYRHSKVSPVWEIVSGADGNEGKVNRTQSARDGLVLSDALKKRVDAEITGFFAPAVKELYAKLRVPYRRGVLLHGPPGNGKTSLIRFIGSSLPQVSAFLLCPDASFSVDDLRDVVNRWTSEAPAILAIEDLDWLLKQVNVSTFLNLIDGIATADGKGMLLIATTNHPETLDPAVNNRPGRFDVVIEIPPPDEAQRFAFLRRSLPEVSEQAVREVARRAEGMSFAHLQEILRLSGMLAIHAGRAERIDADVTEATDLVTRSREDARSGFAQPLEMPFGLGALHAKRSSKHQKTNSK